MNGQTLAPAMRALMLAHALGHHLVGPRAMITDSNRTHTPRAPEHSPEGVERLNRAQMKRLRKQAKRMGAVELPKADGVDYAQVPR